MSRNAAEEIGLRALTWLVGNEELLPVFMGSSGVSSDDLREGAGDPFFLGSVLDFLLMDDAWVIAFCEVAQLAPEQPMMARAYLPGGEAMHWT